MVTDHPCTPPHLLPTNHPTITPEQRRKSPHYSLFLVITRTLSQVIEPVQARVRRTCWELWKTL